MKVRNIMFSGFAAAILMGAVGANAAELSIASQEYVDSKVSTEKTARENADTAINDKIGGSYTAQDTVHDAIESKASQADFNTLNTTVTAEGTGLVDKVAALEQKTGNGNVDTQIDDKVKAALGADFPANSTVKAELDKKQNASDSNVTDLAQGSHLTAGNGVAANLKALDTNLRTAESTIVSHTASIADNATAISTEKTARENEDTAINNKIGSGFDSTNTVAKKIADEKTARETADDALDGRLDTVETTLGNGTTEGLVKDVNNLKSNMGNAGSVADQIESVVGNLGMNAATNKENTVAEALAANSATDKAYTDTKVSELANGAVKANADAIAALDNTYATDADVNAKFGGGTGVNALPAYTACTAESGQCVLSVNKSTGALTWVAVTPTPASTPASTPTPGI